ncbi:hypothetical protein CALCODRAFT_554508 [Calocera cornea HHB12733]|uniref:PHD-type domain-containing protein n=1 Tax=Calocera cornea HHB12733 TaxID=1353952 RepID=A0A165H4B4_9BASI|nr:hypothetical protein CALCODRAFT_554508 [Calocera cornea HHB12733]
MAPRRSARRPPPSSAPYPSSVASDDTSPSLAASISVPPASSTNGTGTGNGNSNAPASASRSKRGSVSRSPEQELSPLASGGSRSTARRGKKSPTAPAAAAAAAAAGVGSKLEDVPEHPPADDADGKGGLAPEQDVKLEQHEHGAPADEQRGSDDVPELEVDAGPDADADADADADEDGDGDEDMGETRCWCGNTDDDAFQIQCEICKMWQHGPCMGFTDQSEVEGENFHHWCEECRPELWSTDIRRRLTRSAKHKRTPSSGAALGSHPPATSPTIATHREANRDTHPQPDSPLLPREPKRRATMNSAAASLDAQELRIADGPAGSVEDEGERRGGKKRRRADDADVASASVPTPPPAPAQTSRARPSRAAVPAASTPSKRPRAAHNKAKDPPSPSAGFAPGAAGSIPDHLAHLSFMFTDPPGSGSPSAAGGSPTGSGSVQALGLSLARPQGTVPINAFSLPALVQHFPAVVAHASPEPVHTPLAGAGAGSPGSPSAHASAPPPSTPAPVPAHEIANSLALKCKIKWPSKRITPGEMKKRVGAMLMWGMRVGSELERREERGRELGLWGQEGGPSPEQSPAGGGPEPLPEAGAPAVAGEAVRAQEGGEHRQPNVLDRAIGEKMPTLLPDVLSAPASADAPTRAPVSAPTPAPTAALPSAPASAPARALPSSSASSTSSADLRLLTAASTLTSAAQAQDLLRQLTQRLVQVNELWNSRAELPMSAGGEGMAGDAPPGDSGQA